ncbi:MAG: aminomethyl-transferring glycine dehydrogenase subunit GcvPA [Candidatus Krumholzibacteria bacterium]|jgi:glycine dehydrogenase subunit 1|nr:aminomethyl-transferring glycine dehydrogenase subunit GcvPA [Candidatus Krumholzibacteria bacterium]MDP6668721.1 aminomethyl-transferring glycine dehydrogenase subunit GcvPA [Candidatus Krumholzibacteria bacterium]MDP6797226.1 aminomethyl-transferring glycine dehydrogenase subunit GcvPA [Candidatus Krumholzibacteria bacterium]MDP7021183.1 aminomethyl-transferring glycine dehydrogenase subunit GcvPA [Candidatus Krumholzibacteria bacterium]
MRGFVPHSEDDLRQMLSELGLADLEELFSSVPADCHFRDDLSLPAGLDEHSLRIRMEDLSSANHPASCTLSFLGGGIYDRVIPAMSSQILSRPEFYTAYTPYQPEVSQGTLQAIFEFQTMIARLTGMEAANASMYDGGSALAEAVLLAGAATGRSRVLLPGSLQPSVRRVVETYTRGQDYHLESLPWTKEGRLDPALVKEQLDSETAALVVQSPNYFGIIEDLKSLAPLAREAGALLIVHCEPGSLALLEPPGSFDADLVTGEAQSLGLPMNLGGPLLGIMAASKKYLRRLPGRLVGKTVDAKGRDGYVLTLQTREQHIRREKATSNICTNQGLMMLAATVYLACLGESGMKELARGLASRAKALAERLQQLPGYSLAFSAPFYQEFVLRTPRPAREILSDLRKEGVYAGIPLDRDFPMMGDHTMLVTVSEKHRPEDLDRLEELLGSLAS